MTSLSHVTLIWSMIAAGALLLGFVHLLLWVGDRRSRVDLAFVVTVLGFVGIAFTELWSMHAATPDEWALAVRWCHPGIFLLTVGIVAFVHLHLGTGRPWLAWTVVGLRTLLLVWNFLAWPNFNFEHVESVARIPFLGDTVTVVDRAVASRWQFLGIIESLLLAIYVLDAAATLWRHGDAEGRRRATVIGGSMVFFTLAASTYAQLVIFGVLHVPFLITPPFLVPLGAFAYELVRDLLRVTLLTRELRDSRQRLELAAGAADLGLWEWNGLQNRVLATRTARELFGLTPAESADYRAWLARVHAEDQERLIRDMQRALDSGTECSVQFRLASGGSQPRWIMARGRAEAGRPEGPALIRGVMRDISELHRVQDETQELRQELALAGRVSLLGQFATSLAHELSQPLGAILRNAEAAGMLLTAPSPDHEELMEIVADIQRDDRRAREVVERLRSMLKCREAEPQTVAVDSLIQDVVAIAQSDAVSRGVMLEHRSSPGLLPVCGDRVQLSQVLLNLVVNAMDAVAGAPAAAQMVTLESRAGDDGEIQICVSDRGPGIPAELARKVFEPFYTTKSSGLGLGLSISRSIAEAHGGSLTVENGAQGGAAFCLRLPPQGDART
jgi:two-component system sensor kinase FixL